MKIQGLDGKIYSLNLIHANTKRQCSSYHEIARNLLKTIFPSDKIWEEVSLPGTHPTLFADFFLPLRKLIIEVHGAQHYEWIPHFHPTKRDFMKAKQLDTNKSNWSQLNNFTLIELPYTESIDEWKRRITNFGQDGRE